MKVHQDVPLNRILTFEVDSTHYNVMVTNLYDRIMVTALNLSGNAPYWSASFPAKFIWIGGEFSREEILSVLVGQIDSDAMYGHISDLKIMVDVIYKTLGPGSDPLYRINYTFPDFEQDGSPFSGSKFVVKSELEKEQAKLEEDGAYFTSIREVK